jgi:soluble lytic murein transglycosylase
MAFPATAGQFLLSEQDRSLYAEAFEEIDNKALDKARAIADRAANPMPAKVVRWLDLARSRSDREDPGSFAEFAEFLDKNPGWPSQRSLRRAAERAMPDDLPDDQVLAWFGRNPPLTVDGTLRFAAALYRRAESERAVTLLRQAWIGLDFTAEQEVTFTQRYQKLITPDDELARLERLLWQRRADAARRQARRVGNGYVELTEARVRLALRRPGVDSAIKRVPARLLNDPGLIFDRAQWRQRKGRSDGAIELLDPPLADVPNPELWWRLRRQAVRRAIDKGDHAAAQRIASHHGVDRGLVFAEGEWLAGWIALRFLKDAKRAYQHFVRLHDGVTSPISQARGEIGRASCRERV